MDDFHFVEREGVLHVLNTPSPAATSSLSIAETVMGRVVAMMNRLDDV
jgi:L-2-hydroxyglutarate oxidase